MLNPRTVNVYIAQLRDFYQYVLHRSWNRYQVPYLHYDEMLPKVPTKEEVNSILDAIYNPKHKAELALLYSSGIRVSELTRLKCKDIYHYRHCIYISRSKNRSDRYVFGLHLYEANTDIMTIKEAMGHKSLSSTSIYLTLCIGNGRSVTSPYDV